ncbi:hypothetical protein N7475_005070 [Penicillium sp. IBT 31633x]|nr:hypothetical protein N7475_005070 [Penicillium sp. IBT 31633x]
MSASMCKEHQADPRLAYHLSLLKLDISNEEKEKASLTPMFIGFILRQPELYGLLRGVSGVETSNFISAENEIIKKDPRLFFNVSSPSKGCLISSKAGRLINPLTSVVFHYDTFIYDNSGSPYEAIFLVSHLNIKIDQAYLNTKRMLDLMAVGQDSGPVPLYAGSQFNYKGFKKRILTSGLLLGQVALNKKENVKQASPQGGSNWIPKYMKDTVKARNFINILLSTIRL